MNNVATSLDRDSGSVITKSFAPLSEYMAIELKIFCLKSSLSGILQNLPRDKINHQSSKAI